MLKNIVSACTSELSKQRIVKLAEGKSAIYPEASTAKSEKGLYFKTESTLSLTNLCKCKYEAPSRPTLSVIPRKLLTQTRVNDNTVHPDYHGVHHRHHIHFRPLYYTLLASPPLPTRLLISYILTHPIVVGPFIFDRCIARYGYVRLLSFSLSPYPPSLGSRLLI